MEWPEVKRRLTKEGTSVQVLADLEGVPYKTMYNRIMQHQIKDGVTYLTPQNSKGLKRSEEMKNNKRKKSREAEKAAGLPEVMPVIVTNDYSCKGCAHCMQTSFSLFCELGHECGENCVCSDYKAFPEPAKEEKPEILTKRLHIPQDKPENIPEDVYTKKKEEPMLLVPFPNPEREGLCPEVMEALQENYKICRKLAESYARQANDYAHLLKRYGVDIRRHREEMMRKLPEVFNHE